MSRFETQPSGAGPSSTGRQATRRTGGLTLVRSSSPPHPTVDSIPITARDRFSRTVLLQALAHLGRGQVTFYEGGDPMVVGSRAPDRYGRAAPSATVQVHHPGSYRRVLFEGSVGCGESYADGWWDTDDLTAFLRLLSRSVRLADPVRLAANRALAPVRDPVARLRRQDRHRDREHIRVHYDLSNQFFERMLDETMMYSCAVFPTPTTSLAEASRTKLDRLCRAMRLSADDHLLEIGTGWGGFAVHAAREFGCRVTTTTISDRQFEYATKRVRDAGLDDRITVLDLDYRDVRGRFDGIVSIEMIEAVDWRDYDTFFRACDRLLAPTGRIAMQAIVTSSRRFEITKHKNDFIKQVIFPGGCLPSIEALLTSSGRVSDLTLVSLDDIGHHYPETLRRWRSNVEASRNDLPPMGLDDRFARLWNFYLSYCEAGFEERDISVAQLVLARPAWVPGTGRGPGLKMLADA